MTDNREVDRTGRNIATLTYAAISTCICGHVFTAVSSNEQSAGKLLDRKYRKHSCPGVSWGAYVQERTHRDE